MASLRISLLKRARDKDLMTEIATKVPTDIGTATKTLEVLAELTASKNGNGKVQQPEGGISIRAGGRKYDIPNRTVSRWVNRGLIPILLETRNEKYIDEKILAEVVDLYKKEPGRGKRTIFKEN